jgi:hypothetical protein
MSELWELVRGKPEVDPAALAQAIERELEHDGGENRPDFRTCLLIRDSTDALKEYWGTKRFKEWLRDSRIGAKVEAIRKHKLGEAGFPSLKDQLMDKTSPETVKRYFRDLGSSISEPVTLEIGGSIALILGGYLSRSTEDVDVVDEIPIALRRKRSVLADLQKSYQLLLTHFQSHYLPAGWRDRLQYVGDFGSLKIYSVDVYDVFLSKLFSSRRKDLDDMRIIEPKLDKQYLIKQLLSSTAKLMKEADLKENAEKNWYILFDEKLPQ